MHADFNPNRLLERICLNLLLPACFLTALVRLPTSALPLHLDVARYAFDEKSAHLLNNRTKSVKDSNDRFGFKAVAKIQVFYVIKKSFFVFFLKYGHYWDFGRILALIGTNKVFRCHCFRSVCRIFLLQCACRFQAFLFAVIPTASLYKIRSRFRLNPTPYSQ